MSVQGDIQSVTADLNLCMWSQRWLGERDLAWGPAHLPTNGTRLRRELRCLQPGPRSGQWDTRPPGCLTQTTG